MSEDEFSKYYLGFRPLDEIMSRQASAEGIYGSLSPNIWDNSSVAGQDYNTSYVDWARKLTTTVNNQGFCGSCWAFSTVEQIESDAIRAGLLDRDEKLSYQQVVSCDHTDWGCDVSNSILLLIHSYRIFLISLFLRRDLI
jgi:C1A family cysteine protease